MTRREDAQRFPCVYCGAQPGESCVSVRTGRKSYPHLSRFLQEQEAWKSEHPEQAAALGIRGNSFANGDSFSNGPYSPQQSNIQWYAPPPVSIYTLAEGDPPA